MARRALAPDSLNNFSERVIGMQDYEIRILKKSGIPQIYKAALVSAFAAIRRARSLAEVGDMIEVWQGLQCVFSGLPEPQFQ
jgi:hypothetical protein